jgi:Transposase DDE domain group 1
LWPDWRHFAFITNRTEDITIVEAEHRDHAVVEQVIADLKDQALAHFPSGEFNANGAWTVLGALAHNLLRWTQLIGLPDTTVRAARTLRRRLLQISGRLTRHGRSWTLHLPARWPWHGDYISALARIRAPPRRLTPAAGNLTNDQQAVRPPGLTSAARKHRQPAPRNHTGERPITQRRSPPVPPNHHRPSGRPHALQPSRSVDSS